MWIEVERHGDLPSSSEGRVELPIHIKSSNCEVRVPGAREDVVISIRVAAENDLVVGL
jgi:hypothetical protein